jgi:hypothetical protein
LMSKPYPMYDVPADSPSSRSHFTDEERTAVDDNADFMSILFVIAYSTAVAVSLIRFVTLSLGHTLFRQLLSGKGEGEEVSSDGTDGSNTNRTAFQSLPEQRQSGRNDDLQEPLVGGGRRSSSMGGLKAPNILTDCYKDRRKHARTHSILSGFGSYQHDGLNKHEQSPSAEVSCAASTGRGKSKRGKWCVSLQSCDHPYVRAFPLGERSIRLGDITGSNGHTPPLAPSFS